MTKKRGLVVKTTGKYCIVVTGEGIYKKIPIPEGEVRPGMEVTYRDPGNPFSRVGMLAASVFILLFVVTIANQLYSPQAIAYVSLDINPSLELSVDKELQVTGGKPFNQEGDVLLQNTRVKGKNIYTALEILMQKAIEQHYIKSGSNNLVISTLTAADEAVGVDAGKVQQALKGPVVVGGLSSDIRVYPVTRQLRAKAQKQEISPGKFVIYEQAANAGTKVSIKEVKQKNVCELVESYQVKLLPNGKKITIKNQPGPSLSRQRQESTPSHKKPASNPNQPGHEGGKPGNAAKIEGNNRPSYSTATPSHQDKSHKKQQSKPEKHHKNPPKKDAVDKAKKPKG